MESPRAVLGVGVFVLFFGFVGPSVAFAAGEGEDVEGAEARVARVLGRVDHSASPASAMQARAAASHANGWFQSSTWAMIAMIDATSEAA